MNRVHGALTDDAVSKLIGLKATDTIGFYGITPVVQASIAAAGTDAATTQALANDLRTKLIALGLVSA
jgi:hypothetical protein